MLSWIKRQLTIISVMARIAEDERKRDIEIKECHKLQDMGIFYTLGGFTGAQEPTWIKCHGCGLTSHHPEDVRQRFCAKCDRFHDFKTM